MKKYNICLIAAALGLAPHAAMAEGLNLQNVLGAIVQGAAHAVENNQRQQSGKNGSSAPAPVGQARGSGALALGTDCGDINAWAASDYQPGRTEQLFGKPIQQWTAADFSQATGRVSACRGAVDGNWRGRTDSSLQYLSEAQRSWERYRVEKEKIKAETAKVAAVMPPAGAEQFFNVIMELNKTDPYAALAVNSYDVKPALPQRKELRWQVDTRQYDQAVKERNARFTAKMPDHMPALMTQLRMATTSAAQKSPESSAKVKGLKGQDLTWSIPPELFVSANLSELCAKGAAKLGFRGEQVAIFRKGCEQFVANPTPEVVADFKQDLSAIPASIDDMVILGRLCNASVGVDALKRACSEQVAELRRNLGSEDQKLAKAWLGEPLSCEEAVQIADMDQDDLKDTFFLSLAGMFETTQVSFFEQVCAAAPQGVQMTFAGQGMFSGPGELFIQTNERTLRGLQPVQITLKSIEGPNGEDLYFGVHIKAEVWDAYKKSVRVEDRPLKVTTLMQKASYPSEWYDIKNCMNARRKRGMGPNSCEKMAGALLYPSVR